MIVDDEACERYGLDPKEVEKIAKQLSNAAKKAKAMGLQIFGGSGSGHLRVFSHGRSGNVADLDGRFDGGDGCDDW